MDAAIETALALTDDAPFAQRVVDITTRGARSQQLRRIEIWFHNVDGEVYITGTPGARSWYANLLAHPEFTFHLKHEVRADLPATATAIIDPQERTEVLSAIVDGIDAIYSGHASRPEFAPVEEWIDRSPLVRVNFN